jgi:hypothetical protein
MAYVCGRELERKAVIVSSDCTVSGRWWSSLRVLVGSALKEERRFESGGDLATALGWVVTPLDLGGMFVVSAAVAEGDRFRETGIMEARSVVDSAGGCC